jgi:small neutral amino acid transporter SnatA (MarC family)
MVIMTVSLVPYLFLIEYLCPYKGWVIPLSIPIEGVAVIAAFIVSALFLNTKINRYYIVAIACLLFGVIVSIIIKNIVYNYIKENGINISVAITALSITFVSFLIFIIGLLKRRFEA